jgi:hypothetical protein
LGEPIISALKEGGNFGGVEVEVFRDPAGKEGCMKAVVEAAGAGVVLPTVSGKGMSQFREFAEAFDLCGLPVLAWNHE